MNINQFSTKTDIDNIDIRSPSEQQTQNEEKKDSGRRFDKTNSVTKYFHKTNEMNGSSFVKTPLGSSTNLRIENDEKYCLLWSILALLHPCNIIHSNRVSNFRQYFNELNNQGFDFSNGFGCSDVYNFEKLNNLSIRIFELRFY